jgi:hypothetical protein
MNRFGGKTALTILLIAFMVSLSNHCLLAQTSPSINKLQSYVFKNRSTNLSPSGYANFLSVRQWNDSNKVVSSDSIKLKSPWIALGIAVVPGVIVHGSGHFYAGKTKSGFWLLGAEVAGASIVYVSVLAGYAASEAGETGTEAGFGVFGGLLLFVGSWVYDVVRSPMVVKKQNEELLQRRHSELKLQIKDENLKLVVIWGF